MKKYLLVPEVFLICVALSLFVGSREPSDNVNPYQTEGALSWAANQWLLIGVVFSVVAAAVLVIDDLFSWLERRREKRDISKL